MLRQVYPKQQFWIVIFLIAVASFFIFHPWNRQFTDSLISWDKLGYYLYLPNFFIYNDWQQFSFVPDFFMKYQPSDYWYQTISLPDSSQVMAYPLGLTFFQYPFFILGHFSAYFFDFPRDGFSLPYVIWINISGIFYTILGLFFCNKSLQYFFPGRRTGFLLILFLLSTNLFFYGFVDNIMPHSYSFFLIALLLWFTIKWHERQSFFSSFIIMLSIGFIAAIRITDILIVVIPVLYGIYDRISLKEKIRLLMRNSGKLFFSALLGMSPFFLQMYYWHTATGQFIFNTYAYHGLGFDWTQPHVFKFLVSFRKGWLIYTPVMLLSLAGIFFMRRSNLRNLLPAIVVFLILNIYLLSSWSVWWFGGSFGQRSMVQSYALLVIPFGAVIFSLASSKFFRLALASFIAICIYMNLVFTWAYQNSLMLTDGMTRTMFKERLLYPFSGYIPADDKAAKMRWKDECIQTHIDIYSDVQEKSMHNGEFLNLITISGDELLKAPYKWIRCTYETQFEARPNLPNPIHLVNEVKSKSGECLHWKESKFTNQFDEPGKMSEWVKRSADFYVPQSLKSNQDFMIYFWLANDLVVNIRNVKAQGIVLKD